MINDRAPTPSSDNAALAPTPSSDKLADAALTALADAALVAGNDVLAALSVEAERGESLHEQLVAALVDEGARVRGAFEYVHACYAAAASCGRPMYAKRRSHRQRGRTMAIFDATGVRHRSIRSWVRAWAASASSDAPAPRVGLGGLTS